MYRLFLGFDEIAKVVSTESWWSLYSRYCLHCRYFRSFLPAFLLFVMHWFNRTGSWYERIHNSHEVSFDWELSKERGCLWSKRCRSSGETATTASIPLKTHRFTAGFQAVLTTWGSISSLINLSSRSVQFEFSSNWFPASSQPPGDVSSTLSSIAHLVNHSH